MRSRGMTTVLAIDISITRRPDQREHPPNNDSGLASDRPVQQWFYRREERAKKMHAPSSPRAPRRAKEMLLCALALLAPSWRTWRKSLDRECATPALSGSEAFPGRGRWWS